VNIDSSGEKKRGRGLWKGKGKRLIPLSETKGGREGEKKILLS